MWWSFLKMWWSFLKMWWSFLKMWWSFLKRTRSFWLNERGVYKAPYMCGYKSSHRSFFRQVGMFFPIEEQVWKG